MQPLIRRLSLAAALLAVAAVLLPPLANYARELFAAHMAQHLLLVALAAPLVAASGLFDNAALSPTGLRFSRPAVAWTLFVATFLFWHWPAAFQWAARTELTRLLELATVFVTACLFWVVAVARSNPARLSAGARALFVVTAAVATDLPGVIMLFAPRAICTMPHEDAGAFGLSPIEDQQIAGLMMWVPANFIFFSIATWLFAQWIADPESDDGRASPDLSW